MHAPDHSEAPQITRYLQQWRSGDASALTPLFDAVYHELRRLSASLLSPHRPDLNLQPTVLLHEFYLRLPDVRHFDWQCRAQLFSTAARIMRNIIIDHARACQAQKRTNPVTISLEPASDDYTTRIDVLLIHNALDQFATQHPRHARCVELRFFGGLTIEESADVLSFEGYEASTRTVERDWNFAKAWLQKYIESV
jgi:RNA polymerase sigma factor (TIGR02999 family)